MRLSSCPFARMKSLYARWDTSLHQINFFSVSSILIALLLSFSCPFFLRLLAFFCPLLISTSVCSAAVYMFVLSGKAAAAAVFFSTGEGTPARGGVLKVYDEINLSICNDNVKMTCLFLKSDAGFADSLSSGEDAGEKITFAGKLEADHGAGDFDESAALLKVDCMAEGVWNYYLGKYSPWHYLKGAAVVYEDPDD